MKNILLSLLILSSSLIYSTNIETKVKTQEEMQSLHQQKIAQRMQDLKEERERSKDIVYNQKHSFDEWKVTKGLMGLLVGVPFFFSSIEGILFLLMCPDKILSRITSSSATSSPIKNFLTNRLVLLSLCGTLSASSLWIIKKSISNLYQGFYGTEDTMEYFEEEYLEEDL